MLVSSQSDMVTSMDLDGCDNFPPSTLLSSRRLSQLSPVTLFDLLALQVLMTTLIARVPLGWQ